MKNLLNKLTAIYHIIAGHGIIYNCCIKAKSISFHSPTRRKQIIINSYIKRSKPQ
jgi:hypothetical protein